MKTSLFMHFVFDYHLCHAKTERFIYQLIHLGFAKHKCMAIGGEGIKYEETYHLLSGHLN